MPPLVRRGSNRCVGSCKSPSVVISDGEGVVLAVAFVAVWGVSLFESCSSMRCFRPVEGDRILWCSVLVQTLNLRLPSNFGSRIVMSRSIVWPNARKLFAPARHCVYRRSYAVATSSKRGQRSCPPSTSSDASQTNSGCEVEDIKRLAS